MSEFLLKPAIFLNCTEIPAYALESVDLVAIDGTMRLLTLISNKQLVELEYRAKYASHSAPLALTLLVRGQTGRRQRYTHALIRSWAKIFYRNKPAWQYEIVLDTRQLESDSMMPGHVSPNLISIN